MEREKKIKKMKFADKELDIIFAKGTPGKSIAEMEAARARGEFVHKFNYCPALNPRTYEAAPGIICDQDVAVKMRDGITIYADIYRPSDESRTYPVLISWSPFGKRMGETDSSGWQLMGVPPKTVSHMTKFESPDPMYWCYKGYAVANVDPRGSGNSEGDTPNFDSQEGRDGYDFIEYITSMPWCSGKAGLCGNSGVAMSNWRIAAEQPPHLACIAPWEASGDMYRESLAPGGIPCPSFNKTIMEGISCRTWFDASHENIFKYPEMNEYWEDKIPRWKDIRVPAYVCAGWCHFHLRGSIEGFRKIRSVKKWLRIHRDYEWPDAYNPYNIEELNRFFDRYLKDIHNGWELMPKVRMDVMDAYDYDFRSRREEREFPLARTEYRKLYLNAAGQNCSYEAFGQESEITYDPNGEISFEVIPDQPLPENINYNENAGVAWFDYRFTEDTEISGYMKLRLWVECRGYDNMDMFVWIKKFGQEGEYLPVWAIREPFRGAWGYMRVSHRELDEKLSSDFQPVQSHRNIQPLRPGEIVPVDIEIWPHSRIWHAGETLRIEIEGRYVKSEWFEDRKVTFTEDNGDGIHVIHTGGKYDSFLQIPVIPPKYQAGEYVYR